MTDQQPDKLYSIADIFVGKPGGLSTAESLRWNLPLLITYTLPGQEEKNLQYLQLRHLVIPRPGALADAVKQELETGNFRESLKKNAEIPKLTDKVEVLVTVIKDQLNRG